MTRVTWNDKRTWPLASVKVAHTVQLSIGGKNEEIEGKIESNIFRNRGQIEGILKVNREQNMFVYIQRFKGPAIPKHRFPSKYTIVEKPSGTMQNIIKVTKLN